MKRKVWINFLIIFFLTVFVLYISLKDDYSKIIDVMIHLNPLYFILALASIFLYWFFRAISLHSMVQMVKKDYTLKKGFQLVLITQFFNAITPFSTGGQPFQIYHLKKEGISYTLGTNIIMQNFIVYQIALVFLGICALIYNHVFHIFKEIAVLKYLVTLGFMINTIVIVFLFLITFSKKIGSFALKVLRFLLLKKKNSEEKIKQIQKYMDNFYESAYALMKEKKKFIWNIIYNFIGLLFLYAIPFFLLKGMNQNGMQMMEVLTASAYTMLLGAFVPVPGATGGIEYGYLSFFGQFISGPALRASMLLWRFLTYYLGLIVGSVVLGMKKDVKS